MGAILKKMLPFYKKYQGMIILGIILGIGGSVLNVFIPKYIKGISNVIQEGMQSSIDFNTIWKMAGIATCVIVAGCLLRLFQIIIMAQVSRSLTKDMRSLMGEKMDKITMSYYDTTIVGDVLSRVTDDISTFAKAISGNLSNIVFSVIMIVTCIVMMFTFDCYLTLCVIGSTILGTIINMVIMKKNKVASKAQRKLLGRMNGSIEENFTGHLVIKAYNCEEEVLDTFNNNNEQLYESVWKSNFFQGAMAPIMTFISNFAYVVVCVVGAILMIDNKTDIGTIVAFILYVKMFSNPISDLASNIGKLQPAIASAERVFEFLDIEENADEGEESVSRVKGEVVFDHVIFGYLKDQIILKDFSATIKPGMKVAIVGPTGAGKSTLVNLLMRFYELNSGNIYIDGVSIKDLSREALHSMIGMVLQETWCFEGSIRDNIVYSIEGVSDEQLKDVIDKVHLSAFVNALPNGADEILSEQSSVSAGQKQLITIARAMVKNAPILILDEATSSVDTRTELYIQNALDELSKGRTSFVIAHRLSTIQNADVIFVLKDGDIIETGNHEELLKKGGFYSELYNSQFDKEEG